MPSWRKGLEKAIVSMLDRGSKLQGPAVAAYVDRTRRGHPGESPAEIVARLEKLYLTAVTGSGGAVGATAAVPGIGTVAALSASGAETLFFLEASALFTLAVAEVHGVAPRDHERRRALVLAVVLGEGGKEIVERTVGRKATNWGTLLVYRVPKLKEMNESLLGRFALRFVIERSALVVGKVIPAGIGAAIGAGGNRLLGKGVISNAKDAFGPPPQHWPVIDAEVIAIHPEHTNQDAPPGGGA
ncbi:MAG: hypothetical protein HOQ24_01580 [Mycobacteriaceae bacterium]|nr:hypothetical protein [Mycobacteriaceae bacterium]